MSGAKRCPSVPVANAANETKAGQDKASTLRGGFFASEIFEVS